ncbi:MAG: type II restriction endonuclease [Rhodobacter sp.]|nr:type II restriction endonuclease [Rhodobacter sp.]MCY4168466.1 type II restriction endonuclease [Rhodobacter sp.]MCY4243563.1 type II restriction endonuclease [Rhodobacter sp.]
MKRGRLRDCFVGVGAKRLSAVDANRARSNQHEVGTTREMVTQFLGESRRQDNPTVYIWLGGDQASLSVDGTATHYDTRARQPHRNPEWRLYYQSNPVTETMREGDTLFLAMNDAGLLYFIVAPDGSTSERQLSWLFDVRPGAGDFVSRGFADDGPELDFPARYILGELGIETKEPDAAWLDGIIEKFETAFPSTAVFSETARSTLTDVRAEDDPDAALVAWLTHEEALFRRLERRIVSVRLEKGFADGYGTDVDGFIRFSLSVQNRRKARMGYSLEHHLEAVFQAYGLEYARRAVTENNHRPDFLFPSIAAYRAAPAEGSSHLTVLGAKSSCKDRWRQVLAEAAKVPRKHLLTLEPGISEPQTKQMENSDLQLVVPQSVQATYTDGQRRWLWSLEEFIRDVKLRSRIETVRNAPLLRPS